MDKEAIIETGAAEAEASPRPSTVPVPADVPRHPAAAPDCDTGCAPPAAPTIQLDAGTVTGALAALSQTTRLDVFRLLVAAGPCGLAAGRLSSELEIPPPTLSFHLSRLCRAGLVAQWRDGRSIIYSANFEVMWQVVEFLSANCCAGPARDC